MGVDEDSGGRQKANQNHQTGNEYSLRLFNLKPVKKKEDFSFHGFSLEDACVLLIVVPPVLCGTVRYCPVPFFTLRYCPELFGTILYCPVLYGATKSISLHFFMHPEPISFYYRNRRVTWYKAGRGEPLIFLHGWGSRSEWMFSLVKALGDVRTCIFLDFPGFGASEEMEEAWGLDDYRDLVRYFLTDVIGVSGDTGHLDHLGSLGDFDDRVLGEEQHEEQHEPHHKPHHKAQNEARRKVQAQKADVLVHSFGCRVLLPMLADERDRHLFGKIVVTGGAGLKPKRTLSFYAKSWAVKLMKAPYSVLPATARERGLARLRQSALWKRLGSSDYQRLSGPMRESFVRTVTDHLDSLLPAIGHEMLLVWGEEDEATPVWMGEKMEAKIPGAVLVKMPGAGHYAFLDKPENFQAIIRAYLTG